MNKNITNTNMSRVKRAIINMWLIATLLLLNSQLTHAIEPREALKAEFINNQALIQLSDGKVTISPVNEGTVEVFYEPNNTVQIASFALPKNYSRFEHATWSQTNTGYRLKLPDITLDINKSPFSIAYKNGKGPLVTEEVGLFNYQTTRGFRFSLSENEKLMGGGQRVLGMNRRGHRMPLYNKAHYGYNGESNQMYYGLPAVMSDKGYAIAFDNSANGFLDIGHTESNVLQFEADAGRTAYIISAGKDYYELLNNFVSATGKQPLPPRWALGNYASRFGYKSQQEVTDTIDKFIESDFPVDAVVLDLYWFGPDIKGHMGNLEWDKEHWPEPEKMIKDLSEKGVKTIVITEPFILSTSSQWQSAVNNKALAKNQAGEPRKFDFYFGNTGLVDVFDPQAQDWFWQFYQKLNEQGVAGWWGDLGEPEVHPADSIHNFDGQLVTANEIHNAYGHKWAQTVYEKQLLAKPNERPFIMMRAGFVGSQRYAMVPWTGDVERSWNGLKPQVELALQMSMFGLAYIHSDLGGFAGGESFDAELYTRWLQYGVFQPVYRPHAQDHIAPEPVFHDETTQNIVREYVKLRYRLLPYNYSLSIRNSLQGTPMMRPLFMDFPEQAMERTDAFMWGDAFLVAPIIEQGQTKQQIVLPQGYWFNFWNNRIYTGGQTQIVDAPLEELPVLVKAGEFVPQVENLQNTETYSTRSLNVSYYHHPTEKTAQYNLYDDDGKSANSLREGQYQTIAFDASYTGKLLINARLKGEYQGAPRNRDINMQILGVSKQPSAILVDGKALNLVTTPSQPTTRTAVYDPNKQQVMVTGSLVKHLSVELLW